MLNSENAMEWAGYIDDEILLSQKFTVSAGITVQPVFPTGGHPLSIFMMKTNLLFPKM
jgi:hypothetical protein